jgi:hypothetical protein
MLFKVIAGKDVFELNPQLKSIVEFERLTSRQMTYVILSTDYKSPFKRLSLDERKYQAAISAGYKIDSDGKRLDSNGRSVTAGKVGNIQAAVTKYNVLQKDDDYETLLSVTLLISQIRDLNNKPDKTVAELEKAVKLTMGLDKLVETKKKLEQILDMREEEEIDPSIGGGMQGDDGVISTDDLPLLSQLNDSYFTDKD